MLAVFSMSSCVSLWGANPLPGTLLRFTACIDTNFPLSLLLPLLARLMRQQNHKSFALALIGLFSQPASHFLHEATYLTTSFMYRLVSVDHSPGGFRGFLNVQGKLTIIE